MIDDPLTGFGDRLRAIRMHRQMSQKQLAEWFGCCQTAVSDWEHGKVDVGYSTLLALSDKFGVPITYWFYGGDMSDVLHTKGNGLRR